jgi:hypothetical protein
MVVCCRSCNQAKKYLTPAEMILRAAEAKAAAGTSADDTAVSSDTE